MAPSTERLKKFKDVISKRQLNWTVILENVHDPHNIGAVMRTCDSVGIQEIYVVYTEPGLQARGMRPGHKSSSGTRKWMNLHYYKHLDKCMDHVKSRYEMIYGTSMTESAKGLYEIDLSGSCAIMFGNEHEGLSKDAISYVDQNFIIPQVGLVKSLNISVACAVSLYEGFRQRSIDGSYDKLFGSDKGHDKLMSEFVEKHVNR